MASSAKFWDKAAEKYSRRPIGDEAAYQKKLETTQKYFRPEMKVLEFGCGTGGTARIHSPHVRHIRAIDISPAMIEIARDRAAQESISNIDFEVSSIEEIDAADESFDAILGLSILHLLEDRDAVLARIYRLLKPGGFFASSTVCIADMNPLIRVILPVMRFFGQAPLVRVFDAADLKRGVVGAGFDIDHEWRPKKNAAIFIVANKPGEADS